MGYEYKIIDGGPFAQGRGRLRLQEIAEGTIVQWTFTYETTGLIGGLRNSLSLRRQVDKQIVESLRKLYRLVKEQGGKIDMEGVKSLMRDAPAYEQRLEYKPRYPSVLEADSAEKASVDRRDPSTVSFVSFADHRSSPTRIEEDDTKPNPVVRASDNLPQETSQDELSVSVQPAIDAEPSFLSVVPSIENQTVDQGDSAHIEALVRSTSPIVSEASKPYQPAFSPVVASSGLTKPLSNEPPRTESSISTALETREVSVFDVFGVPRPSKTQEMRAAITEVQPQKTELVVPMSQTSRPPRTGYRLRSRRQFPRLRRPSS